jgi:hypothetical protein
MSPRALTGPNVSLSTPRRIALGTLTIISILVSPALVVYECLLGLVLVVAGYAARLVRSGPLAERRVETIGFALLAGPLVYAIACPLAELFNW